MKPWVQYVIAFIVFCHGFVYLGTRRSSQGRSYAASEGT
jgi:hypothetical protein